MSVVFDTQALLGLYLGESGAYKVSHILENIVAGEIKGYMNVVNLAELYYILCRRSRDMAEEKEKNLRSFGIEIVSVTNDSSLWKEAATMKSTRRLSLADAFAAATAIRLKATLVTGSDREFRTISTLHIEKV